MPVVEPEVEADVVGVVDCDVVLVVRVVVPVVDIEVVPVVDGLVLGDVVGVVTWQMRLKNCILLLLRSRIAKRPSPRDVKSLT